MKLIAISIILALCVAGGSILTWGLTLMNILHNALGAIGG